jgi:serine/threonine-protein kinase
MVSHYRIVEKIGAGGMGEVYLAEDTELDRKVALKFLPSHLCQDDDFRERFKREAQAAAGLDHPNIVTIYEVSEFQGRPFFAMEHVGGQSLRDLIGTKKLDPDNAIDLAVQICEGLAKAHQTGITHRDIKPSNIALDADGRAKILDFGLAAVQGSEHLTQTGSTLGTIGYMSPEQAEGKEVDHRSDIFSLGAVLYEMITGRRPFERDNQVATIQAIITATPEPLARYKSNVPDDLQRIVTKLMVKNPASRYQHIDEVPVDLRAVELKATVLSHGDSAASEEAIARSTLWRRSMPWAVAALLAIVAIWSLTRTPTESPRAVARVIVAQAKSAPMPTDQGGPVLAVSPDGKRLVYVTKVGSTYPLALREIGQLEVRVLPGTEGEGSPFFSPDGQWIGFFAGGELKKLFLDGGKPVSLCEAKLGMGGSWGIDDTIFFTPVWNGGIWKISANGGEPIQVTTTAEGVFGHWSASMLPGGKAVLFSILNTSVTDSDVAVLNRETGEWRIIVKGATDARYSPTGHILYAQSESGTIVAAPFDLDRLEIGEPRVPVLADVMQSTGSGHVQLGFSEDGLLYYIRGGEWIARRRIVWINRQGEIEPLPLAAAAYIFPSLTPDGKRLAVAKFERGDYQIWVHEIGSERITQLTFEIGNRDPVWMPDGNWLSFISYRNGPYDIYHMPVDRSRPEEALLAGPNDKGPNSWSLDGKMLLFTVSDPETSRDVWLLSTDEKNNPQPLIRTTANEQRAYFHPSGNWIVYQSDESGRNEIFVTPFPGAGTVIPISILGGSFPRWSRDGRELFYRSHDSLMVVDIQTEPRFQASTPRALFEDTHEWYDVAPDGRFLMIVSDPSDVPVRLVMVFNWFEELNRLVPVQN